MSDQQPSKTLCLMRKLKKKVLLIPAILILAVGSALIADKVAYDVFDNPSANLKPIFKGSTKFHDVYDCYIPDGHLIVSGYNPRFSLYLDNELFSSIRILFREPVDQDISLQVYYAPVNGYITESDSLRTIIPVGSEEEILKIPDAAYSDIRFDFDQNVIIEDIYIGNIKEDIPPFQHNYLRMAIVFAIVFIPLCILILIKTHKIKSDET